ncbi:MAG TPA: amidohydrolase [Vicinamibacterales bacterium]|nr:amidohydrolase [Vicinamibacterales bacterium]
MVPMHRRRLTAPPRLAVLTVLLLAAACASAIQTGTDGRRHVSLVVSGGTVITVDPARRIIETGAVAIDGDEIVAVDTAQAVAARFTAAQRLDATGDVILPGLVNTHTHAAMVLYRGLADDLALKDWLEHYIFPAEARTVSPEMVRIGTRLAALEMIRSGTTTFADMYYFEEEVARETRAAGLRGVLGQTIIGFPAPDAGTPAQALARTEAFIRAFRGDPLITPAPAPHAMYTLDEASLRAARALADRYDVPVLIHVAETQDEVKTSRETHGASPVGYLASLGFLAPRVVAAHGVWLDAADIATMRATGAAVSHNPESNMKLASGTAPVPKFLEAGLRVGLGTDGAASNNDLDMFEAMRQAAFVHKLVTGDPRAIPAAAALEMATIGGARCLGLDARIGSLEPGKRADLIVVSMRGARQVPVYNPVSHLVYVSRGDDVRTSVVQGKVLMHDRRVLTLDEPRVLAEAAQFAGTVKAAVTLSR